MSQYGVENTPSMMENQGLEETVQDVIWSTVYATLFALHVGVLEEVGIEDV